MNSLIKIFSAIAMLSFSAQLFADNTIWHIKGIHPEGNDLLAIKAIGSKGELHDVKAIYDDKSHILDIKVLDSKGKIMHAVKAINEKIIRFMV
jgi:hypothetical protein